MSVIRYTLRVSGEEETFSETDYFPAYPDLPAEERIRQVIVEPLNKGRSLRGEPHLEIVGTQVINPFTHLHSWKATRRDTYALKEHYVCERCCITGYKLLNIFTGPYGGLNRNPPYDKAKFELCKDPLKPLPKTINFG